MILHHVGIVVDNLAEAIPLFEVWMGSKRIGGIVEDEVQGARVQLFLMNPETILEVVEAIPGDEYSLHKSGDFHLCYTVPDIDEEMARLHDMGSVVTRAIISSPIFQQQRMAFLATHSGQLIELLEEEKLLTQ